MNAQAQLFRPAPSDKPMLHLRSWAWVHARVREGRWKPKGSPPVGYSGRAYTIMAFPNVLRGEIGDGRCEALTPAGSEIPLMRALVQGRRAGDVDPNTLNQYRASLNARWASLDLSPAVLDVAGVAYVQHGDALACACSADEALAGRCHRAMAAPWLARSGWSVWLDGAEVVVSR